jgi:signal transduction histidine kinase
MWSVSAGPTPARQHCGPGTVPSLQTDSVKLKVILKNLISNAIKFTARGTVVLTAREAENGVEFAVSDTGIGIAPEAQAVIFEPFRKADSQVSVHYEGAGLGLYVTRRLVEALGGTIGVESEPGRGSTFRVWLPLHIGKVPRVRVPSQITGEKPGERVVRH